MGYQRDRRFERLASNRLQNCEACKEIDRDGLSYATHTCGQKPLRCPFNGDEIERVYG
jgi:hypothetical protein